METWEQFILVTTWINSTAVLLIALGWRKNIRKQREMAEAITDVVKKGGRVEISFEDTDSTVGEIIDVLHHSRRIGGM